jgi:hypothetical protein
VARSYSIAKSGIGSWTSKENCSLKTPIREIAKSRNDHSRPFQRTGGSRSTHRHIGISEFGVSSCQRNLTSQLAKSRYVKSRSDLSRPYLLDTWRTSRAPSAYRHSEFQGDSNSEHRKSRYPEAESGPSIFQGRVAQIRGLGKSPEEESAIGISGFGKSRNLRTSDRVSFQ